MSIARMNSVSLARRFQQAMNTINEMIIHEYELELARKTNELQGAAGADKSSFYE